MFNQATPLVYPVLNCSDGPPSSDDWDSGAVEDALLSKVPRLIRADDFSAPSDLTPWWAGPCVMTGCESKSYTVAAACGFALKGRGHSNYWLCHQSMMKVLLAWRASCSSMSLGQFKPVLQLGPRRGAVNLFKRENRIFIHQFLLYVITFSAPADGKEADSHDQIQSLWQSSAEKCHN